MILDPRTPGWRRDDQKASTIIQQQSIAILAFLLLGQWAVTMAVVALHARGGPAGRFGRTVAPLAVPVLLVLAMLALGRLPMRGGGDWMTAQMLGLLPVLGAWGRLALLPAAGPGSTVLRWRNWLWMGTALVMTGVVLISACLWLGSWFNSDGFIVLGTLPQPGLWSGGLMALNLLAAGLLLAGGLQAARVGWNPDEDDPVTADRLDACNEQLLGVLLFRLLAIGVSVGLAMVDEPLGRRFFWISLWRTANMLLVMRLFLGLLLPALHVLFSWTYLREGAVRAAGQIHLQNFIIIMIGEMMAAGLTYGMLGVGF